MRAGVEKLVFVIENERTTRESWRRILEAAGYQVQAYAAGNEARRAMRQRRPLLVVLDLSMPTTGREEGFRVLDYMCKHEELRYIPVVIVTAAFTEDEVNEYLLRDGYEDLVKQTKIKPITNEELLFVVEKILNA